MASAGGGGWAKDEIPAEGMETAARLLEAPGLGRIGSKRVRDSLDGQGYHDFCGVTTSEKKAAISSHMHMNHDGTFKVGGRYLHGTHGEQTLPDFDTLRSTMSSPGEILRNEIKMPTKICTFYSQKGWCNKGNSCPFLHEIEGSGSDYRWNNEEKAGLHAADGYGNSRGSEEGSQVQCLSNLRVPQYKDSDGLTKDKLYRSLVGQQSTFTPGFSHGIPSRFDHTVTKRLTTPVNELVPSPVVYDQNQEPSVGRNSGLTAETYLNGRGPFLRSLDGGILPSAADKRTYLDMNRSDSKLQYLSFDPSDPLQRKTLSAYGGSAMNFPITHHKGHLSSHAPYSSYSLPDSRNPLYATSNNSFGSATLREPSHLGKSSQHLSSLVTEKVAPHKHVDVGTGTSRPALLASNSSQPSIGSPGLLSPIKDEVWVTSVPFVPSFDFPDLKTPPRQYDPFVDYVDSPKDNKNNLKSSSISSQHTNPYGTTKSLNHDEKLARNMSAKGSNELACMIASDKGRNSCLGHNNKVKVHDRKPDAACHNEKARNFRFRLADHVKELITPMWKEGSLTKDAFKLVVKKSIDKVLSSIEPNQVPTSEEAIVNYITISKSKIEKLVKGYVDMHRHQEVQSS